MAEKVAGTYGSSLSESINKRETQEEILSYLLLRILLNQQARVEKVKELSASLYNEFGGNFFTSRLIFRKGSYFQYSKKLVEQKGR
ncbi:hypothetical protein H5T88_02495 [bacterium]|nr:hypothetical protein [bacterium]